MCRSEFAGFAVHVGVALEVFEKCSLSVCTVRSQAK